MFRSRGAVRWLAATVVAYATILVDTADHAPLYVAVVVDPPPETLTQALELGRLLRWLNLRTPWYTQSDAFLLVQQLHHSPSA
jgi:hypothetical protein